MSTRMDFKAKMSLTEVENSMGKKLKPSLSLEIGMKMEKLIKLRQRQLMKLKKLMS